jgi:ATP-binding cassette subfamily A (ABC1) protein 3
MFFIFQGHRLKMHICHRFPGSSVAEHLGRSWRFALPLDRKLPDMFREIEEAKDLLDIEEYSLAQASLEQIFNSFAKSQEE